MECKIFISSTFKDMQNERDIIRNEVLPEIEKYALQYGVSVDIVDLRWGINTSECEDSDEASVKILKTCFDEITICKPFFIGIIGERYGWIPSLNNIKNSIDNAFKDRIEFKEKSVTEYEMDFALNTYDEDDASFIFCLRNKINGELSNKDKEIYYSNNELDKSRIKLLKEKIKNKCPNNYLEYEAFINNDNFELTEFKNKLTQALKKEIDQRFSSLTKPQNDIEKELIYQLALINQKASYFSGREIILNEIKNYYDSNEKVLGIYGVSGIGKSSLVAHEVCKNLKDEKISTLYFLCGVSDNSNFVYNLVINLYYQVCRYLKIEFDSNLLNLNYVQEHLKEIINDFYVSLIELSKIKKVRIYVDALDQLVMSSDVLSWLNAYYLNSLDKDIKIIFSYIPYEYINKQIILKNIKTLELDGISNDDIILIAKSILNKNKKTIPNKSYDIFLNKKNNNEICSSNPLYLSMILQEIINFDYNDFKNIDLLKEKEKLSDEDAIYTYIYNLINNAPCDIEGEFLSLINRVKLKIDSNFVDKTLGIISMSRNGVPEVLVKNVLEQLGVVFNAADFSYLKKTLRLFIKENNKKIDYSHKIIDNVLEDLYFNKRKDESLEINKATVRYLMSLNNSDEFKKSEYLFYLKAINDESNFYKYLIDNIYDEVVLEAFFEIYSVSMKDSNEQLAFYLNTLRFNKEILNYLISEINKNNLAFSIKEKLLLDLMSANDLDIDLMIKFYTSLIEINYYHKSLNSAQNYIDIVNKLLIKYYRKEGKYHVCFKRIYIIYRDILLTNKSLLKLKLYIKMNIYYSNKLNDYLLSDYLKIEYLEILKNSNYKKYKNKLKRIKLFNPNNEKYLLMIKREEYEDNDYLESLNNHNFEYGYINKELIDKGRKYALENSKSIEFINIIKRYIEEIDTELLMRESLDLIRKKSYFYNLIGDSYIALGDLDRGKIYLEKSLELAELINKLSEEKEDLLMYGNVLYSLEIINNTNHQKSNKVYKSYRRYNKYDIDFFTRFVDIFIKVAVFGFMTIVYIIGGFYISLRPYVFSFMQGGIIDDKFMLYLFDNTEVFLFLVCGSFLVYLLYYLHSFNRKSPNGYYYLKSTRLYLLLTFLVTIGYFIIGFYKFNDYFLWLALIILINIIIGAYSLFVIIYYLGRIISYHNKINSNYLFNLYDNKIKRNSIVDIVFVSISFVFLVITKIFETSIFLKGWHNSSNSELAFSLLVIISVLAIISWTIEVIFRIIVKKKGEL